MSRSLLSLGILAFAASSTWAADTRPPRFEEDVRPILKANCFECHGEEAKPKGGLDLRLSRLIRTGGDTGPSAIAGKPEDSPLLQRVVSNEMPPGKKKLTASDKEIIRRWIAAGAKSDHAEPETLATGFQITESDRNHWAFRSIAAPTPPGTAKNPIDAFLLASLTPKNLGFSPEASREVLIRRAYFDLLGLPPSPEEVAAFVKDASPNAWEQLIDRLLAMPQYGERWGRHWLDVAGYADSEGYAAQDTVRVNAWKYRDYVVQSFNADKPFDQFIREQVAGDELLGAPPRAFPPEVVEKLTATGFLRMAPDGTGNVPAADQLIARNQVMIETVKIVTSSLMGLTVGCAQCHNHRYDPISQVDYYRIRAVFEPAFDLTAWKPPAGRQLSLISAIDRKKALEIEAKAAKMDAERLMKTNAVISAVLEKELAKLPEAIREKARAAAKASVTKRTAEQKKLIEANPTLNVSAASLYMYDKQADAGIKKEAEEVAQLRASKPVIDSVRALYEVPGKVPATVLFHRGDPEQPKEEVGPGILQVLEDRLPLPAPKASPAGSGRRLAFAHWLTDAKNPLTARVLVNRFWHEHFGHGLVRTLGDFGRLGEKPTHPELLDWLASEFIAKGWSVKHLHRLIMTSQAYRQASRRDPKADTVDPDNHLLSRFPLRRLDAEAIRDSVLSVSGALNGQLFGAPVPVRENEVGQVVLGNDNRDGAGRFIALKPLPKGTEFRRSLYVQVRRSWPLGDLAAFDWASVEPNCEIRNSSTVTPQSLLLLNGDFLQQQAELFAERVMRDAGSDSNRRVERAWALAFGVAPTAKETADASAFVKEMQTTFAKTPRPQTPPGGKPAPSHEVRALAALCQVLISSNRFLYVD